MQQCQVIKFLLSCFDPNEWCTKNSLLSWGLNPRPFSHDPSTLPLVYGYSPSFFLSFLLSFRIEVKWYDSRLTFINLKENKSQGNTVDLAGRDSIWIPNLIFSNCVEDVYIKNDDLSSLTVKREGVSLCPSFIKLFCLLSVCRSLHFLSVCLSVFPLPISPSLLLSVSPSLCLPISPSPRLPVSQSVCPSALLLSFCLSIPISLVFLFFCLLYFCPL